MSRATDTHLILRQHEEEEVVVLDAAVRSFPPLEPLCMRWTFPVWQVAQGLDPAALKDPRRPDAATEDATLLLKLDQLDPDRCGVSETTLREALRCGQPKVKRTVKRLIQDGTLEIVPLSMVTGNGARTTCQGIRRRLL
jgi:hypothetical protein